MPCPCRYFIILQNSMFVTVFYLNAEEIFLLQVKGVRRELGPLLLFNTHCPLRPYCTQLKRRQSDWWNGQMLQFLLWDYFVTSKCLPKYWKCWKPFLWRFERGEKKTVLDDIWKGEETLLLFLVALAAHVLCQEGSLCTLVPRLCNWLIGYIYSHVI